MAQRKPIVLRPNGREHMPLAAGGKVETSSIPISGQAYNTIQVMDDGIYVGSAPAPTFASQYVSAATGNDDTGQGTGALLGYELRLKLRYIAKVAEFVSVS